MHLDFPLQGDDQLILFCELAVPPVATGAIGVTFGKLTVPPSLSAFIVLHRPAVRNYINLAIDP